jgi:hypothetical protein
MVISISYTARAHTHTHTHTGAGLYIALFFSFFFSHNVTVTGYSLSNFDVLSIFSIVVREDDPSRLTPEPQPEYQKLYCHRRCYYAKLVIAPSLSLALDTHTWVWVHLIYITCHDTQHNNPQAPGITYCIRSCSI